MKLVDFDKSSASLLVFATRLATEAPLFDSTSNHFQQWNYRYTSNLFQRLKDSVEFDNIVVMNMHDQSKDIAEALYCDVMPHAHHTCEAIRTSTESLHVNSKSVLVYRDLAYGAKKKSLVEIETQHRLDAVTDAVQKYQQDTLHLTSMDFKRKCLSPETLEILLEKSLEYERMLFPEVFDSPLGEADLRSDFERKAAYELCELDVEATLGEAVWQEFFKNLMIS